MEMPGVLPKKDKDDSFDVVVRPSIGRAILIKGSSPSTSVTAASEILAAIDTNKTNRMITVFNLVKQLSAQHAEQKAKLSAQRAEQKAKLNAKLAEQKAKLSAQRYAQFIGIADRAARWREEASVMRARRIADEAEVRISRK